MEFRDEVNASEERLLKVLGPVSNVAQLLKSVKHPEYLLTLREIVEKCNEEIVSIKNCENLLDKKISQVCRAGSRFSKKCLCVALYGDTDNVMRWAIKHGALAVVADHQIEDIPCIVVNSPEAFYARICGHFRSLSNVKITAVAGSIGKTTTKRMITSVYKEQFKTFNDPENENQMDCVGYICQHIPTGTEMQVQEVSEDTPGCMLHMSEMLRPDIVVITAIDKSHIEQFESQDKIYDEVCAITKCMSTSGIVIVNTEDKEVLSHISGKNVKTIGIEDNTADCCASNLLFDNDGIHFNIIDRANAKSFPVLLHNVFARHNALSALYAFAAGVCAGEKYENILKGLDAYRTLGIRQNIYDSENGVKLYVDCYNAVGKSVESAIVTANEIPIKGKRIAVIGDIEEAGSTSEEIHKDIVRIVNDSTFTHLLTFGPKIKQAAESVHVRSSLNVKSYLDKRECAEDLRKVAEPGDIVLFKASRKSALETIIERIWPKSYKKEMRAYSMAKLKWRLKVIFS